MKESVDMKVLGVKWFGESWGAPVCNEATRAPIPVGEECMYCGVAIREIDRGALIPEIGVYANHQSAHAHKVLLRPFHLDCFLFDVKPEASL